MNQPAPVFVGGIFPHIPITHAAQGSQALMALHSSQTAMSPCRDRQGAVSILRRSPEKRQLFFSKPTSCP